MMSRRTFLKSTLAILLSSCVTKKPVSKIEERIITKFPKAKDSKVYVIKTEDREYGVKKLLENFDLENIEDVKVAIKANYNSADPFPATTHLRTLSAIVDKLKELKAHVILAERSGMGETRRVLEKMGVISLATKKEFDVVVLDELRAEEWVRDKFEGMHWKRGYLFPRVFKDNVVVQTCCLKTHRFGGHFTLSLKNSVGMVAKFDPLDGYNYMSELHSSKNMRKMIAEINVSYQPEFVVLDAIKGFSTGGPESGTIIEPKLMLASKDRIAIDAVGVSILRIHGTTKDVSRGRVFEQEQIARAVELGLGAEKPEDVELIPLNREAEDVCEKIEEELRRM